MHSVRPECGRSAHRMKSMGEMLLTLEDLCVGYDGKAVLSGLSAIISRAGFTAVLGLNGAGKSTLLKTLLGLIPPVSGRIISGKTPSAPGFGYVPQSTRFDPIYLLSGFDVALMWVYGRVPPWRFVPSAERDFTLECLRTAGAEEFAHKRFSELSGGQKQRVLIARALATRPDILVLDEPTAGVDAATTVAVLDSIDKIRMDSRVAVLLVTHDFSVARRHAEHVILLHRGKAHLGSAEEMLSPQQMADFFETGIN